MKVKQVCRKCGGLAAPFGKTEENPDTEPPESSGMGPLRSIQPPVVVFLGSCRMKLPVGYPVVGLLIDDQSLGAGIYQRNVVHGLHGGHLQREAGNLTGKTLNALPEVTPRDELGMLSGHQQNIPESLFCKVPGLGCHLFDFEGDTQDRVVA